MYVAPLAVVIPSNCYVVAVARKAQPGNPDGAIGGGGNGGPIVLAVFVTDREAGNAQPAVFLLLPVDGGFPAFPLQSDGGLPANHRSADDDCDNDPFAKYSNGHYVVRIEP